MTKITVMRVRQAQIYGASSMAFMLTIGPLPSAKETGSTVNRITML
jgi:hypothetical protein